jgi:hypothetical protein
VACAGLPGTVAVAGQKTEAALAPARRGNNATVITAAPRLPCMQDGQAAAGGGAPHPTPGNPESSSPFLGTAGAGQPPAGHTSSPAVVAAAAAAVTEVGRSLSLVAPPQPQAQPQPQPQPHTQVKEALTNRYITSPRELPAGLPTMLRKAAWNMSSLRRQTWSGGSHRQRGCSRVSPRAAGGRRQAAGGRRQAAGSTLIGYPSWRTRYAPPPFHLSAQLPATLHPLTSGTPARP